MSEPTVLDKVLFTSSATSTGGRDGHVKSSDGLIDLDVRAPRAVNPGGAVGTNPEQLFAAGYSACFGGAVALVAKRQKIVPGPVSITANVSLGAVGDGFGIAVELVATIPGLPRPQAEALVMAAHEACPYSKATRGNIVVNVHLA
jgi:osmotically inducible protein OsmC